MVIFKKWKQATDVALLCLSACHRLYLKLQTIEAEQAHGQPSRAGSAADACDHSDQVKGEFPVVK
jgi:hypothetical protein